MHARRRSASTRNADVQNGSKVVNVRGHAHRIAAIRGLVPHDETVIDLGMQIEDHSVGTEMTETFEGRGLQHGFGQMTVHHRT